MWYKVTFKLYDVLAYFDLHGTLAEVVTETIKRCVDNREYIEIVSIEPIEQKKTVADDWEHESVWEDIGYRN